MTYAGEGRSGDSMDVPHAVNKRKPNFTEGESLYLISQSERDSGELTSKLNDSQQSANIVESPLSALSFQTFSAEDQKMTHTEQVPKTSSSQVPSSQCSGQSAASTVPMSVASSMSEIREVPRVIATSAGGGVRHRLVVPQHKRMLSSPLAHVLKKRMCSDYADESFGTHVRAEIDKLKKEKLMLEKEKLALEKEKLVMEKEKLALEIHFLRDQMD